MLVDGLAKFLASAPSISSVIGTRADGTTGIWPILMPEAYALPAIVYSQIAGDDLMSMDGADGLRFVRFQFSCYASSYLAAKQLAKALRQLLQSFVGLLPDGTAVQNMQCVLESDTFEEMPFVYHTPVDFEITYSDF